MNAGELSIGLVGPLPPPSGGMANQTEQLAKLLRQEGVVVELIPVNPPYRPRWTAGIKGLRALIRLIFYIGELWRAAGRVRLLHIMANSGWSWHLFAAPAIWVAKLRGIPAVVNYRGGGAEQFFATAYFWVKPALRRAGAVIVPSGFLQEVFARRGVATLIVRNIIDLQRYTPSDTGPEVTPHVIVTRNLERIYDIATALRAFQKIKQQITGARLTLAGSGPEREELQALAHHLGVADAVNFTGRLDNDAMATLYRSAAVMLNPSLVDNMPISILESWASGVPVVSTRVGGVPYLVEDGNTGLLVSAGDADAMASALMRVLSDRTLAKRLSGAGLAAAQHYTWPHVKQKLLAVYYEQLSITSRPAAVPRSGWYTSLCSKLLFPAQERLKGHQTVAVRREMEQTQWWPAARLQQLQLVKLQRLLTGAAQQVPYYRELFGAIGFDPGKFSNMGELRQIPFLTKPLIRANLETLKAETATSLARFNTGGSSGEPLIFYIGKERVSHDVAAKWRATRWWDVDIGDPEIVVWGSPIELGAQDAFRGVRDKVFRTKLLPAFEMSEAKLTTFLMEIRAMRPRMLFGYPSAIAHIARHAESRGLRMDDLGIKVAFVTAERLYDEQREQIQSTFGCRVANGYGGRDAGFIAHQCPAGGMHITAEDIILEIVDNNGDPLPPGQSGEIVVTHLATAGFPFIRYRTGDMGALDENTCPCGRGLPLLKEIQGRSTDFVVAQDGTVIHGLALIYILRDSPGVRAFKIIQESLALTRVLVVLDPDIESSLETIRKGFRARLGSDVEIQIEKVGEILPEQSGKYRYVVSKVTHP